MPVPTTPPPPGSPQRTLVPTLLLGAGIVLAVVYTATLLYLLTTVPTPSEARRVPLSGGQATVGVTQGVEMGVYSDDPALACEAVGADGAAVALTPVERVTTTRPRQALSLLPTVTGDLSVTCRGSGLPVYLDYSTTSSGVRLGTRVLALGPVVAVVVLGLVGTGGVWLLRVRSARHRALRAGAASLGVPATALPAQVLPAPVPPAPVPPAAQAGAAGAWAQPAAGGVPPHLPAAPGYGQAPGAVAPASPVTSDVPARPVTGPYGIAPQQVVYRPAPTQGEDH